MENFELSVSPVEDYKAPEIPTFENNNSALLKKLPSRWQKNAKIIAGLGIIGVLALSGRVGGGNMAEGLFSDGIVHNLGYTQGSYRGFSEANLLVRLHTGGRGISFYMVHLTEQEAFGIIRARLEAAGLNFDATPPGNSVSISFPFLGDGFDDVGLDLFDIEKDVGVTHVGWLGGGRAFMPSEREVAGWIGEMFAEQAGAIEVGVFYNPGQYISGGIIGPRWNRRPSSRETTAARPILVRQLINQADMFIARLQSEGILERFPDVSVTVNGAPLSLGDYPILINNQKMVPAREIFEALDMVVVEDINSSRLAIIATKNDIAIWVTSSGGINITRNGNREWPQDIPVLTHNDIILVPLQFVADLAGAAIEWDEDTRTIKISY